MSQVACLHLFCCADKPFGKQISELRWLEKNNCQEFFVTGVVSWQLLQLKEYRTMNDLTLAVLLRKKTLGNKRESA